MKKFNAKLMLFGEYSIMAGSPALTIPYLACGGLLSFSDNLSGITLESNQILNKFLQYIRLQSDSFQVQIDENTFKTDIEKGLFFDSTIPEGYGLGSSGALVAAVFDKYAMANQFLSDRLGFSVLQKDMGIAESYFHCTSSGIDPLSIYIGKPLLLDKGMITILHEEKFGKLLPNIYLFDTGIVSATRRQVNNFNNRMKEGTFRKSVENDLAPAVSNCIHAFIDGNNKEVKENMYSISRFQFENFKNAIPEHMYKYWQQGLETGDFIFKLCGSGGGGYMLIYTDKQKDLVEKKLNTDFLGI
jgi:mevalonate kinase